MSNTFLPCSFVMWLMLNCVSAADDKLPSPCLCLERVMRKLYSPVEYVTIGRSNSLLTLIVEQRGVVRTFVQENRERKPVFMNITDRVTTSDTPGEERGLLSLALHPRYNQSRVGRVFVYYITTHSEGDRAVVSEFQAYDDVVDATSERRLLHVDQPSHRANGGQLLFGDDGYLYIFTGDGEGRDESVGHAQDLHSFLGKALRVDVDRQGVSGTGSARAFQYDVPASNPFLDHPQALPEIFALGFFNPWRCSQDSAKRGGTGAIFCGDTGLDQFEEINVVEKGRNYGWNLKEGDHCYVPVNCSQIANEGVPIHSYPYDVDTGSAVVGGFVYRGNNFSAALTGHYLFGDVVSGKTYLLWRDNWAAGGWSSQPWPTCPVERCPCHARALRQPFLLAFGQDAQGEVMLLMTSEFSALRPKGVLYRVLPPTGNAEKEVTCGGMGHSLSLPLVFLLTFTLLLPAMRSV